LSGERVQEGRARDANATYKNKSLLNLRQGGLGGCVNVAQEGTPPSESRTKGREKIISTPCAWKLAPRLTKTGKKRGKPRRTSTEEGSGSSHSI